MDFDFLFDYIHKWFNTNLWYKRVLYLDKILKTIKDNTIKIISWIRRVWKSYILKQIIANLIENKNSLNNIFYIHLEDERLINLELNELREIFNFFIKNYYKTWTIYVFLDEIQNIKLWEKFIRNLQENYENNIQIFITWSNSNLLSSELSTILTWRYIDFTIYPFSFKEYLEIKNISLSLIEPKKYELFNDYLTFWWLPEVIKIEDIKIKNNYLKTLVQSIIFKDIVQRYNIKKTRFLEDLIKYIYSTTCSNLSINSILKYLKQEYKTLNIETVNSYIDYITNTFLINNLSSLWNKTKHVLKWKNKFYSIDTWIRNIYSGNFDIEKNLENFVFIELKRRWYELNFLEWSNFEIDFLSNSMKDKKYFQVSYTVKDEETFLRETKPFFEIKEQYEKILLTLDQKNEDYKWIKIKNIIDWSLE